MIFFLKKKKRSKFFWGYFTAAKRQKFFGVIFLPRRVRDADFLFSFEYFCGEAANKSSWTEAAERGKEELNDFYIFSPGHRAPCHKQVFMASVCGYGGVVNIVYFSAGIEAKVASF